MVGSSVHKYSQNCPGNVVFEIKFQLCRSISLGKLRSKFMLQWQFCEYLCTDDPTIHHRDGCDYKEHNTLNLEYSHL